MTQTAMEIQSEIDKTDLRITELETERARQTVTVEATEKAFVDGTADIAKLNDAQGSLSILTQTLESLRSTYLRLTSAFGNQSEAEARREQIKKMVNAANDVEPLLNDYLKTRLEFHEIVADYAEKLFSKATAYQNRQAEYQAINAQLEPPATYAEIQEIGLNEKTRILASATFFNHVPLEYGEVIARAESQVASRLNKLARGERVAAFHARTIAASAE